MEWLRELLKDLVEPVKPQGKGSINVYAGKRLDELDKEPRARADALDSLEQGLESGERDPKDRVGNPDNWKKIEEEAARARARRK